MLPRQVLYGALLIAVGLAVGTVVGSRGGESEPAVAESPSPRPGSLVARSPARTGEAAREAALERRLERLAATLAAEANARQRLGGRLETLAAELEALRAAAPNADSAASVSTGTAPPSAPEIAALDASTPPAVEEGASATERALVAAGVDPATAADIKRRSDEYTLSELYLRDQAGREQWLNTPQFRQEMAEIERQRPLIRDEIGDEAYDRYLTTLGEPNRVMVDEVLLDSAAAQAGLQAGDVVLRYGEARIFAPNELVNETRSGTAGERIRLEVLRQGQRLEIDVPRGPLGLRITASRGAP